MRIVRLVTAIVVAAAAVPAVAQQMPSRATGRTLSDLCKTSETICLGYVVGALDAYVAAQATWSVPLNFCVPASTTNQQILDAVLRTLRTRPQLMDANAAAVVAVALATAYPCAQPPRPVPPKR